MKNDEFDLQAFLKRVEEEQEPEFEDIWMHNISNYLLLLPDTKNPKNLGAYSIYEIDSRCVVLVEDDTENADIVKAMLEAGVHVVNRIPDEYLQD